MRAAFLVLACLLTVSDPAAGSLDLGQLAPWSPPTAADTLTLRLTEARWNADADASREARQEFWRRFPHHQFLLEEVARWHCTSGTSAALLNALATGTAEALTGLSGLTDQDRLLLEGCALYYGGKLTSAQTAFERLSGTSPSHSLARYYLYSIDLLRTGGSPSGEAHARAALQDPEASQRLIGAWVSASPWAPTFDLREEARSLAEARTSPPVLQALLRGEAACDSLESSGLSPDRFAELLDELHADSPAVCNAYLDDLVELALVWISPTSIREVLEARSGWFSSARFAEVSAVLWRSEFLTFQLYAGADPSARTVDARGLSAAADWHHDPAEVERWARQCAENDLARSWDEAEEILRERGHDAAADSLRAAARREAPHAYERTRLWELSWADPSMSSALLDSLVSISGERSWGWQLLMRSEAAGDRAYLEKCLERYGARWTIHDLGGAIAGAQRRGDGKRLEELAELVRRLAPGNTVLLDLLARASLGMGNHDLARAILTELGEISPRPPSLTLLEVDLAVAVKDPERAKSIIEELLDSTDASPDQLSAVVYYAGYYGWTELAERSMRMLESIASPDSRQVGLCRAELLRLRGDLEGARQEASRWREAWPGSETVRRLLVKTGGIVEEYAEASSNSASTALAGLEFDYESTDWIQAGRSKPGEFPAQDMLILRDRVTYYVASTSQLVTRQRFTAELLSEAAVQQFQTLRIPFLSGGEVPRMLCARIVTPEGEAYAIPPEQMLISAHEGEEADVGDQRDLVIPLPGLKPGTVVDYCYQLTTPPFLDAGHAWVARFGNVYPQREEIVDIVVAQGIEHIVHRSHEPAAMERRELNNPEDVAFSIQAASQVLGGDLGGDGDEGAARRRLAREMLAPALAHPEAGGMPYLLAASLAAKEDRYQEADSLTRAGLERTPNDPYLLGYAIYLNEQLSRRENVIDYLRKMQSGTGGDTFSYLLIRQYLASNRDDDAQKEERRLHLIASEVDSTELISAKIAGYLESGRSAFAREVLASAEARFEHTQFEGLRGTIAARERRWEDAIEAAAFVQKQYPLHPEHNNNLAWFLACAGRDLERAEYLIRTAIALSDDASMGNTLGLVLLRQGDLKGAQEIFTNLMHDERPAHRVVNAYFSGLCLWMEGRSRDAVERWESVKGLEDGEYSRVVQETLDAVSRGADPTWILLSQESRAE